MTLHWSKNTDEVNTTSFDELALEESVDKWLKDDVSHESVRVQ